MNNNDIGEAVLAHRVLLSTDDFWLEVHEGRLSADEVGVRLHEVESDELRNQSKAVFERRFSVRDEEQFGHVSRLYNGSTATQRKRALAKLWLASSFAVAVLLVLWFNVAPSHDHASLDIQYTVELRRDLAQMRSSAGVSETRAYRLDRSIEIWLRPMRAVDGPIEVIVYARSGDVSKMLPVEPTIEENGSVHIVARVAALDLSPGEWELHFAIARKGTLPERIGEFLTDASPDDGLPYVLQSARIRLIASPGQAGAPQ